MKSFWKRTAALAAALVLGLGCARADTWGLDGWLDAADDIRCSVTAQLEALMPFGETTVGMLNGVLRHLSVEMLAARTETTVRIAADGDAMLTLSERSAPAGTELATDLLPNRTLTSAGSAMDALSGRAAQEPSFDLFAALEELEGCYRALTDAILPYAEQKKANYNIKNVGSSRWSRIARLTPEQGAELAPLIAQVLGCGMDEAFRRRLEGASFGKGFIVGLYQSEQDGDDLAVYIKGSVTLEDGKTRTLAYQWAFGEKNGKRVDTFRFELSKSAAAADSRTVFATLKRSPDADALLVDGECKTTVKEGSASVTTTETYGLSGRREADTRTLEGSVTTAVRTAEGESASTVTTAVTPALTLSLYEGSGVLSGTADVRVTRGKELHTALTLTFAGEAEEQFSRAAKNASLFAVSGDPVMPASSLDQNVETKDDYLVGAPPLGYTAFSAPDAMQTVDLDAADDAARGALLQECSQALAGRLLTALSKLPEEDAALLRDAMSAEDFETLSLVSGL